MSSRYHHRSCGEGFEARAPYNFVPLPEKVLVAPDPIPHQDLYQKDRHTGFLILSITTETPLYVRCAYPPDVEMGADGHPDVIKTAECQNFFHHGDVEVPVIPGSTLRGMTRSLVEILSYSKISFPNQESVLRKQFFHRGVGDTSSMGGNYRELMLGKNKAKKRFEFELDYPSKNLRGGYLEVRGGEHYIRPALQDSYGETFVHIEETKLIAVLKALAKDFLLHTVYPGLWVLPAGRRKRIKGSVTLNIAQADLSAKQETNDWRKANLVVSGQMDGKHMHCAVYEPDGTASLIRIPPRSWALYQGDLEIQRSDENQPRDLQNAQPLFYLLDDQNELVFFGPTMMFRLPYPYELARFVPEFTRRDTATDLAEAIFGVVNKERTLAGRVSFTDAEWMRADDYPFLSQNDNGRLVPRILSSPKPTSFQLYLNQPDTALKTRERQGKKITEQDGSRLKSYYDDGQTVIRGFKSYWHRKSLSNAPFRFKDPNAQVRDGEIQQFRPDDNGPMKHNGRKGSWRSSSQHTIIRPVKRDVTFCGKVYFQDLSKLELGALLTALRLPGTTSGTRRHKLGMGKPLGLGTVRIEANLVLQVRASDEHGNGRYDKLLFSEQEWQEGSCSVAAGEAIAADCLNNFRQAIVSHYNSAVSKPLQLLEDAHLDGIPRIDTLYTMLEWDNGVSDEKKIDYLGLEAEWEQKQWRRRHVLPHAQIVAGKKEPPSVEFAGGSPEWQSPTPQSSKDDPGSSASLFSAVRSSPAPGLQIAEDVTRRIMALRGPGEVSLVAGIVQKIESISEVSVRLECAQEMKRWLERNKFWNNPKHAEKDWRKSIQAMLDEGGSSTILE